MTSSGMPPRVMHAEQESRSVDRMSLALGVASLGLGVPMVVRPGAVDRALGIDDGRRQRAVTTAIGVRELLHAAGLLHPRIGARWVWTRVGGDVIDLAALAGALRRTQRPAAWRTVAATAGVVGITALDLYAAVRHLRSSWREPTVELTATTTVGRDQIEVYTYWRRLERLPEFMAHVSDVRPEGGSRSRWTVTAPFGRTVEWQAEIVEDVPGQLLAWRSVQGSQITNAGTVRFAPAPKGQGTEVHVTISYGAPGGRLGEALARWAGEDPHQQLDDDLRRFKQVIETGEVIRSDGAPWGKRARREFPQHAARPLTDNEVIDLTREEVHA